MTAFSGKKLGAAGFAALYLCKLGRGLMHLVGRGGTNLPGKLALRLCPALPGLLAEGMRLIVVSGTNGKTTTCRMIERGLRSSGIDCLANRSGANLLQGITAELAANADLRGRPRRRVAVIECDEAALKQVTARIKPEVLVFTNVFRDQLDRYGELSHTLGELRTAAEKTPESLLCLNADDPLVASLAEELPNPHRFYGVDVPMGGDDGPSDAMYCIRCKTAYDYSYRSYGHLGGFSCPGCGYARPAPDVSVARIDAMDADGSRVLLSLRGRELPLSIALPAAYNIYNAAAAAAALDAFGIAPEYIAAATLAADGFGRMENFPIGRGVRMILVKNPAGLGQVLEYLSRLEEDFDLMLCLNDLAADGRDVSWIWDAPLEKLAEQPRCRVIYTSGRRREDMYLRLKYAETGAELRRVESDRDFLRGLESHPRPLVIVPTYTAMLRLRGMLAKSAHRGKFWE